MSISRYSLLPLLLLLSIHIGVAQQNNMAPPLDDDPPPPPPRERTDTFPRIKSDPFIRLGFDVSALGRQLAEKEVRQFEFSLDTEMWYNWFTIIEGGFMNVAAEREGFSYSANGFFTRVGADYNLLKRPDTKQNDQVLIGVRYAYSLTRHEAPFYFIPDAYWGDYDGVLNKSNYNVHWLEFNGGVRTEVFKNLFLGWSIKARVRLYSSRDPELNPYYIPGFGHGKRRNPAMIHYSILYKFGL
jgi:hypothetical protein